MTMKRTLIIVLLLLAGRAAAHSFTGTVVRVIDGDTVVIQPQAGNNEPLTMNPQPSRKVRLAGIDAPEKKQAFGPQAKKALEALVLNKTVVVEFTKRDRYRRIIGTIFVRDSDLSSVSCPLLSVNEALVRLGHAWWYRKYSSSPALAKAEEHARTKKLGLWNQGTPITPWKFRKR
jgi:endonuclease YncB( thermonuclease family)